MAKGKNFALVKDGIVVNVIRNYRDDFKYHYDIDEAIAIDEDADPDTILRKGDEVLNSKRVIPEVVIPEPKPYVPSEKEILLEALKDKVTEAELDQARQALISRRNNA